MSRTLCAFVVLLLLSCGGFADPFLVVSDFDDTMKQTHSEDFKDTVKSLADAKDFVGLSDVVSSLVANSNLNSDRDDFVLLTGAYTILRPFVEGFLNKFRYPRAELYLRGKAEAWGSIYDYKTKALEKIWQQYGLPMVLIGDDVQKDPEVYIDFLARHPEAVMSIHIHGVKGRPLPGGLQGYLTPYEIAVSEFAFGRLELNQVLAVGNTLLDKNVSRQDIFPEYMECPKNFNFSEAVSNLNSAIATQARQIESRVARFCRHRFL